MSPVRQPAVGLAALLFAAAFNVPYGILATTFDYPAVLRHPAGEVLRRMADGGAGLILTWHAFALAALAFVPLSIALALRPDRLALHPALAVGAAIAGSLAGLTQAMGLWRWVFAVPHMARLGLDPTATAATQDAVVQSFEVLHLYAGVAIGEHMGQWLTALFVLLQALLQRAEGLRLTAAMGFATAAVLALGTTEGLLIALGRSGEPFVLFTIAGYLGVSAWLAATGLGLLRTGGDRPARIAPAARPAAA